MRRLLTGYAITFNLRHRRSGHLFQNRYKSILCQQTTLRAKGYDFERLAERVAELFEMPPQEVLREGKYARTVPARSVLCYWANRELGISTVELAQRLKIAQSTATQSVARGERIVAEKRLLLSVDMK
jgi:chromosomal replication initiation ATPase DnaA